MKNQNNPLVALFQRKITKDESRDTGMAMVLLLLILYLFLKHNGWVFAAVAVHVINMTAPLVFRPIGILWFGFSHLLGTLVSKVLLTVVFIGVVLPIALVRRMLGKDALKLRAFKAGQESVLVVRNHEFVGKDLDRPY